MEVKENDIVQITNTEHEWFPCLVTVSEVKSFGVQGYVTIPMQGDAYIRLVKEDYVKVGEVVIAAS
jgi:hypothetical protein